MVSESWRHHPRAFLALSVPPALWLAVFFIIPLVHIFFLSFSQKEGIIGHELTWTGVAYLRAFEPIYLEILAKSLIIAASATLVCLLLGYPTALAIAFAPQRFKIPLLLAVTLPFWINIIVRIYSLIAVFRTRGYLNFSLEWFWNIGDKSLEATGFANGLGEAYIPLELLYSDVAVVFGIVYVFLPFMILPIYAAMDSFNRSYLEASLDLGAGHWRTLFSVLLPMTLPGVVSGIIIVFVPSLGAFFIVDMLGGTDSQLIGNIIDRQFKSANNWPFGSALSFLLMYITFACIVLRAYMARRIRRQDNG